MRVLNDSDCAIPPGGAASCLLDLDSFGNLSLRSDFRHCADPPHLAVHLEMASYGSWAFRFLGGNGEETRRFGPDFWPLWLRLSLLPDPDATFRVKGCVEAIKSGESVCFLSQSLSGGACAAASSAAFSPARHPGLVFAALALLLCALLLALAAAAFTLYRRSKDAAYRYAKHQDLGEEEAASTSSGEMVGGTWASDKTPPLLPGAARFVPASIPPYLCPIDERPRVRFGSPHSSSKCCQTSTSTLNCAAAQPLLPSSVPVAVQVTHLSSIELSARSQLLVEESLALVQQLPPSEAATLPLVAKAAHSPGQGSRESDSGHSSAGADKLSPSARPAARPQMEIRESPL